MTRHLPALLLASGFAAAPAAAGPGDCTYLLDDGASENAVGLNSGLFFWCQSFTATPGCPLLTGIEVEFGPIDPAAPNTTALGLFVYDDPNDDGDPADAVLLWSDTTSYTVANENDPVLNAYAIGPVEVSGGFFVGCAVDGAFPAAIDQSFSLGRSWTAFNITNPDDPLAAPGTLGVIDSFGFAGNWMLRAEVVSLFSPCRPDTNGDHRVDVNDLNNVILDWGTNGATHGGDITGPSPGSPPDGTVDVNDLNAVIVGWGPCPLDNDDCGTAVDIGFDVADAHNVGSTLDPATPPFSCGDAVNDVWFRYTTPFDATCTGGTLHVATCGSDFDTVLEVYEGGGCGARLGRSVACADDGGPWSCFRTPQAAVSVSAVNDREYLIRVGGKPGDAEGNIRLSVSFAGNGVPPAPNDTCDDTLFGPSFEDFELIAGAPAFVGQTVLSSTDPPAAGCGLTEENRGVWYWLTGDGTQWSVEIDCLVTDAELRLDVFCVEPDCDKLLCLAVDYDECVPPEGVVTPIAEFCTEPGKRYAVLVSHFIEGAGCGGGGSFRISAASAGPCGPPAACGAP